MRTAGFLTAMVLMSLAAYTQQPAADSAAAKAPPPPAITYNIFPADSQTYGYDIFVDGKKYIHQSTIPALAGTRGFATKADAAIVAEFVITKIRKRIVPPTITRAELTALGIRVN